MVSFIKDKQRVFGLWQDSTTPQSQIGKNKVVVCHHYIYFIQVLSGIKKCAAVEVTAVPVSTLTMIGRYLPPNLVGYLLRPVVSVSVPFTGAITCQHFLKECPGAGLFCTGTIQKKKRHGIAVAVAFVVQPGFQTGHARIPATAFGQRPAKIHLTVLFQIRKVFQSNLVLQRYSGS